MSDYEDELWQYFGLSPETYLEICEKLKTTNKVSKAQAESKKALDSYNERHKDMTSAQLEELWQRSNNLGKDDDY